VVVDDFHVLSSHVGPAEADAPLIVDADAVLPGSVAPQRLQPVAGDGRRSSSVPALLRRTSRLRAWRRRSWPNLGTCSPSQTRSVSLSWNDLIMTRECTAPRDTA
jgi:hypothetical protein